VAVHVDASVPLRRISVEGYFRMGEAGILDEDERLELLCGAIVEVSPPSPRHDDTIEWLTMRLVPAAIQAGLSVRVQSAVVLEEQDSVPLPDLVIVDRRPRGSAHPATARLAIEVSASSRRIDLELKARIYAEARIPEYWVVDVPHRRVVVHGDLRPDGYASVEVVGTDGGLCSPSLPDLPPIPVTELLDGDLGR
jgi:Uma2 family endonuclease